MKKETQEINIKFYARCVRRPGNSKNDDNWYRAEIVSEGTAGDEEVINEFAELADIDYDEARRLHDLHNQAYVETICEHKKLSIKDIGLVYLSLKSALMKGKRGITGNSIKGIRIIFYPSKVMRTFFSKAVFTKTNAPKGKKGKKSHKK